MDLHFYEIKKLVKGILLEDKKSRCSDKWLYTNCLENMTITGITSSEKEELIYLIRKARLPKFATVMRSRQYLQAEEPSLADELTKQKRRELEEQYRREFSQYGEQ